MLNLINGHLCANAAQSNLPYGLLPVLAISCESNLFFFEVTLKVYVCVNVLVRVIFMYFIFQRLNVNIWRSNSRAVNSSGLSFAFVVSNLAREILLAPLLNHCVQLS